MPTVCSAYDSTPLIFRGRVLQITPIPPEPPTEVTLPDGTKSEIYGLSPVGPMDQVRFQVLEVFKGDPGPEITLAGIDQIFGKGGEFLVYAQRNPKTGEFGASAFCARTGSLTDAQPAADLAWLRAYPTAPPTAAIFGSVYMDYGATDIPLISVTASGAATTRTVATAGDHTYTFKDLPPGDYTVTAVLPAGYTALDKDTASVTVTPKGCAEVDWAIRHDSHIRGTVTDSFGNPAPNVHVTLLTPTSESRYGFDIGESQRTDATGRYDISKADPGDYWVALNYDGPNNNVPYAPAYYPSGSVQSTAKLIHLDASDTKDNINLVLPPPLTPVSVHLRIVNPDGSPVVRANVSAADPAGIHMMFARADDNGNADITLYAGRDYSLTANTSGDRTPACAGPVRFTAREGLQLGALTLDKTIDACRALQHPK
jgi:hypothetical protein